MEFTLGDPTSLQCLLQLEIVKSACIVADVCKRIVGFGKMYNSKINLLTPNVNYSGRTTPLTSKVAFYIFIQKI